MYLGVAGGEVEVVVVVAEVDGFGVVCTVGGLGVNTILFSDRRINGGWRIDGGGGGGIKLSGC